MRPWRTGDLAEYNRWRDARGQGPKPIGHLSSVGFVVDGTAAGFLFRLNGTVLAFLDGFCTNPAASAADRGRALDEIVEALILEAKRSGVQRLHAITNDDGIAARCELGGGNLAVGATVWWRDL